KSGWWPRGFAAAGLALRASHAGKVAGIYGDCDRDAGSWNRREYGAIFRGERRAAQSIGVPAVREPRRGLRKNFRIGARPNYLLKFPRLAAQHTNTFIDGHVSQPGLQLNSD